MPPVDDIDRIMAVMAHAFDPHWGEAWNRRQIEDSLTLPTTHYLLTDSAGKWPGEDGEAAGFALTRMGYGEAELLLIGVIPALRGLGLGRALLQQVIAQAARDGASRLFLEMRHNNPAEHLYQQCGFSPVGQRPAYYRVADGTRIDGITYARDLP